MDAVRPSRHTRRVSFLGTDMKFRALSRFIAVCAFALASVVAGQAVAQSQCEYPACPANTTYHDGGCYDSPQFFTNAQSHTLAVCNAGDSLDRASGICHKANCSGGGSVCQEKPLCPSGQNYSQGGTDAQGPYGDCTMHGDFGSLSHEMVHCDAGWTLDATRGVCRLCPMILHSLVQPQRILPLRLPDLTFRKTWLSSPAGAPLSAVPKYRPYLACFTVVNIGTGASGNFRVSGGGLGIPTNPYQDQAGLAAGASRDGCLTYPTTPAPGNYQLGLTADSLHAVTESNEGNNDATIKVTVTP